MSGIAVIHDLTGVGRCALSVILPVLSAMGKQACPAPTALLSTHPRFSGYRFQNTTAQLIQTLSHWQELNRSFEAVYIGFIAEPAQLEPVLEFARFQKERGALILVDPVMGDNGQLYRFFDENIPKIFAPLLQIADISTPNLTEALFLSNNSQETIQYTLDKALPLVREIQAMGTAEVVLTSVYGESWYNLAGADAQYKELRYEAADVGFPGTGDIFASVLLGYRLNGLALIEAAERATAFCTGLVHLTVEQGTSSAEGLNFERELGKLL